MPRTRRRFRALIIAVALVGPCAAYIFALREGVLPRWADPLATVLLSEADGAWIDWRLQRLATDRAACAVVLGQDGIEALSVADKTLEAGCGWRNAVRLSGGSGAAMAGVTLNCATAAAIALWLRHSVQPASERWLGSRVAKVRHAGGYACRNIRGTGPYASLFRSQHARANAIDVMSFQLADGRIISVRKGWRDGANVGAFLREIHDGACRYFRVALGPEFNRVHADHFHLDRGTISRCK